MDPTVGFVTIGILLLIVYVPRGLGFLISAMEDVYGYESGGFGGKTQTPTYSPRREKLESFLDILFLIVIIIFGALAEKLGFKCTPSHSEKK